MQFAVEATNPGDAVYLASWIFDPETELTRKSATAKTWGGLIAANGHLITLTERGTLVLSRANPGRYTEVAQASVLREQRPASMTGFFACERMRAACSTSSWRRAA